MKPPESPKFKKKKNRKPKIKNKWQKKMKKDNQKKLFFFLDYFDIAWSY